MLERGEVGERERPVRRYLHVRLDSSAFPVRAGDRIDRARDGNPDLQRRADIENLCRMRPAPGDLADQRGALAGLEVVRELLAAGERSTAHEHVNRAVQVAVARYGGKRPVLPSLTSVPVL